MLTVEHHGRLSLTEAVGREARVSSVVSVVVDTDAEAENQRVIVVIIATLIRVNTIPALDHAPPSCKSVMMIGPYKRIIY